MPRKTASITKDPNYYNNYYKNNKERYNVLKKKSYAITQCGLNRKVADKFENDAMIAGRFQKMYLQMKNDCPDVLEFMLHYLANGMIFDEDNEEELKEN